MLAREAEVSRVQQIMERSLSTQKAEELADHHMEVEEKKKKKGMIWREKRNATLARFCICIMHQARGLVKWRASLHLLVGVYTVRSGVGCELTHSTPHHIPLLPAQSAHSHIGC